MDKWMNDKGARIWWLPWTMSCERWQVTVKSGEWVGRKGVGWWRLIGYLKTAKHNPIIIRFDF